MRIDLHLHSTASDGSLDPAGLVRAAAAAGLDVVALADHDTTAGVPAAVEAAGDAVRVIPALEVSTSDMGAELHILGYFVDPTHAALLEYARSAARRREERVRAMVERLNGLGVPVSMEDVLAEAPPRTRMLGRPHIARALVRRGHVGSIAEAFERYLGDGRPAFEPMDLITPAHAIELIHLAGGLAVWAHPPLDGFEAQARRLAALGLDGVECFRPRVAAEDARRLRTLAASLDLFASGGSDWHGDADGPLGAFHLVREQVPELMERAGL
ncbi:MAG: PHP domain-containing protein [bacterium]|jgi:predicted metal-dependent phosphoesterase TrpH|nr:MAG: phosphatase [bacterium]